MKRFQEPEVGGIGKTGPENAVVDHREVQRRHQHLVGGGATIVTGSEGSGRFRVAVGAVECHGFGAKNGSTMNTGSEKNAEERFNGIYSYACFYEREREREERGSLIRCFGVRNRVKGKSRGICLC